jgi:predicted lipid carrier protein YhbT
VATKRQVEAKLRELMRRLDGANQDVHASLSESLPDGRVIEVTVPDLEAAYWTELRHGRMTRLHTGAPDRADIRIRVGSDDLVALVDGRRSLFSSYVGGQVKIEASFSDLLRLRKLA